MCKIQSICGGRRGGDKHTPAGGAREAHLLNCFIPARVCKIQSICSGGGGAGMISTPAQLRMPNVRLCKLLRTCGFRRKRLPKTNRISPNPKLCSRSTRASLCACHKPGSASCYESAWTHGCRFLSQRSRAKRSPVSRRSASQVAALSEFLSDWYVFLRSEAIFNL